MGLKKIGGKVARIVPAVMSFGTTEAIKVNGKSIGRHIEDVAEGASLPNLLQDLLFGRNKGGAPSDPFSQEVRNVQKKASGFHDQGIDEYAKEFGRNDAYDSEATNEVEQGVRGLLKERGSVGGGIQEGVSRRGIQGTTAGLQAQMGSDQAYNSQISALRSDIKNRVQNLKKARTEKGMELSSSILGAQDVPMDFYGRKSERVGGVLPLLTGGLGAYMGAKDGQRKGGAGFQAGMGLGQYMQGNQG